MKKRRNRRKEDNWGYLFAAAQALCETLAIKAQLGARMRQVYESKDRKALKALLGDYRQVIRKLEVFYRAYKKQWFIENKPHGFDVQDIRIGGLIARIRSCQERLQALYDGKIDVIEELEETQLDLYIAVRKISVKESWLICIL